MTKDQLSAVAFTKTLTDHIGWKARIAGCSALYPCRPSPRDKSYDVLSETRINEAGAKALADAANGLWQSILDKDPVSFGLNFRLSFEAQIAMFPRMVTPQITGAIRKYEKLVPGWKISGAGGGGYLVLASEKEVENAMQVKIRRK